MEKLEFILYILTITIPFSLFAMQEEKHGIKKMNSYTFYTCSECPDKKLTTSHIEIKDHIQTIHADKSHTRLIKLSRGKATEIEVEGLGEAFNCIMCNKLLAGILAYQKHIKRHNKRRKKILPKDVYCPACNYTVRQGCFNRHINSITHKSSERLQQYQSQINKEPISEALKLAPEIPEIDQSVLFSPNEPNEIFSLNTIFEAAFNVPPQENKDHNDE